MGESTNDNHSSVIKIPPFPSLKNLTTHLRRTNLLLYIKKGNNELPLGSVPTISRLNMVLQRLCELMSLSLPVKLKMLLNVPHISARAYCKVCYGYNSHCCCSTCRYQLYCFLSLEEPSVGVVKDATNSQARARIRPWLSLIPP